MFEETKYPTLEDNQLNMNRVNSELDYDLMNEIAPESRLPSTMEIPTLSGEINDNLNKNGALSKALNNIREASKVEEVSKVNDASVLHDEEIDKEWNEIGHIS